eukprot:Lithocolla_globosa_v1_NODE_7870_length_892_cov_9.407407.p2 type:complete len:102 gc:universal NODE_7870_length_892_cov_9.407407:423-118(-)
MELLVKRLFLLTILPTLSLQNTYPLFLITILPMLWWILNPFNWAYGIQQDRRIMIVFDLCLTHKLTFSCWLFQPLPVLLLKILLQNGFPKYLIIVLKLLLC